ncbi:MAG: AI-2E family transporter [Chloroflexota bacterium]
MTDPHPTEGLGPRERNWLLAFLIIGSTYLGLLLLQQVLVIMGGFSQILLIIFLAWLLAFVMSPVAHFFEVRLGLPRGIGVGVAYLFALVLLGSVLFTTGAAITQQLAAATAEFPETARQIETTLADYQSSLGLDRFDIDLVVIFHSAQDQLGTLVADIFDQAQGIAGATLATLGALFLILILSLYMLIDSEKLLAKLNRAVPRRYSDEMQILESSVARAFGGFLRAQLILAVIQALLVAIVGSIFGIKYLFLVGTLSALAMVIPFFGPPLALIPPILAAWIYTPSTFLISTVILVAVQTVVVNWLQPRLMRGALGMHPILVLVGLLVGAQVAGVWGALFGIPVIAVLNVFLNLLLWSELPNVALPEAERLSDVGEGTMVSVARAQVSDETHPHIHVRRTLRPDGQEQVEMVVDDENEP